MEQSTKYNPALVEDKWYNHWMDKNYFHSEPDDREAYSIVIPPPNVTGVLHMGHMLNNTIQDILIRKARLEGKNACWVPGTDHASIATEAKVVALLRKKGIKKSDLTREEFLEHAFAWKEQYGGIILQQLRKLGASCDWERTAFTMDKTRSNAVYKAFVDLYNRGKLYRGKRMVNWDPEALTVLSNEEVIHGEEQGNLYHVRYQVEGSDEFITIATTRPETILGDSAVAVHPEDERYTKYKGRRVIVPLVNRSVPIIYDDYVDVEFGTGALKVTPAHDVNDYEIGKRHNLEVIDVLNDDGSMSDSAQFFIGMDRFDARREIKISLKESGNLVEIESHMHSVGRSERTNAVVEPKLSLQWYVDMKSLSEPALKAVESDEVEFFPKNQKNTYRHWMENIRDWCISRQLWWGQQIPAWYLGEDVFVAMNADEALVLAKEKTGNQQLTIQDLRQDEDVFDTWFSSWLWPISVFDGWNDKKTLDYYYPTNVLVTGWDIIFLWVARMVMAGYEWEDKRPFNHVYFTGMVRDKQRRKMSKSLGNSPDALKLIEDFGADGVRFGMLNSSPAGGDLLFDDKLCDQGKKFCNKMWNALNLIKGWEVKDEPSDDMESLAAEWVEASFQKLIEEIDQNFKEYRLSEALTSIYSFVWNDFFSWYLEMIKPAFGESAKKETVDKAKEIYTRICTVLHPFMPFITEEIWHGLKDRKEGDDCIMSIYPTVGSYDTNMLSDISHLQEIISSVRDIRNKNGISMKEKMPLVVINSVRNSRLLSIGGAQTMLLKMAHLSAIELSDDENVSGVGFIVGADKYILTINQQIDVASEINAKEEELKYQKGFVNSIQKKLGNERFVNNAPEQVVANERKKLSDGEDRIRILEEELKRLKSMN